MRLKTAVEIHAYSMVVLADDLFRVYLNENPDNNPVNINLEQSSRRIRQYAYQFAGLPISTAEAQILPLAPQQQEYKELIEQCGVVVY